METHARSIAKSITWRIIATVCTGLAAWGVTGSIKTGLGICLIDCVVKTMIYYFHERLWQNLKWGLPKPELIRGAGGGI